MTNDPCWKNAETSWSGDANDWSKWSEDLRHKKSNRVTKSCCDNLTLTEVIGCLESYPCTPYYFSYTTRES